MNRYTCAPLNWADIEWLRALAADAKKPLLLQGITHPADAKRAVGLGVDGVIVSNHDGRNLDTQSSTIAVLPSVVDAVAGRVPLLFDGGNRRSTNVMKALAFGASVVLIGRPYLHGLAVACSAGVRDVIGILRRELEMAMALTGCPNIASISLSILYD
ncbi:alpha-hydroxy-acid oxidizing protein [Verrucomicrobiales bacterium]|nr:alpha-hydroxy-acid oxidizing protein [Verrucomicrobiales bacterium]